MEKRLQQALISINYELEECPQLRDRHLSGILATHPNQRTKEHISHLLRLTRRLTIFRYLLGKKPAKYRQITDMIASYCQARSFRAGDTITITGNVTKYVNILLQGKVHLFVPKSEQAYLNSVKQNNTKSIVYIQVERKNLSDFLENNQKPEQLPSLNGQLTRQQAAALIKVRRLTSDLRNPHIYQQIIQDSQHISAQPLRWKRRDRYEDCIAVCITPCVCLSLRWQVYSEIKAYRQHMKKRTNIRLLLNFFKGLKYDDVVRYTLGNYTVAYEDKEQIVLDYGELYLVAEGEVIAAILQSKQIKEDQVEREVALMNSPTNKKFKLICRSYTGELIGCEELPFLRFYSHQKSKIFRLDASLLKRDMQQYPALTQSIQSMLITRREYLMKAIDVNQNAAKQLNFQKKMLNVHVTERRDLADLGVMEALKARPNKGHSHRQFISVCQITRNEDNISVSVNQSHNRGKLIRCKRLINEESERELFMKLGFLNQQQITRHNSELLKRRASNGNFDPQDLTSLVPPLGGKSSKKSFELQPLCLPSLNLFSKRCSLRLKGIC